MADLITPNMSLTVPTAGGTLGPTYANEINADLTLLDQHDHSTGKGVPVTPAGLAITSDLSIQANNLTNIRTARLAVQSAALSLTSDLNCLYDVNGDLYFNDGVGNQVRITSAGSVNAGSGNITGLLPPAAVTYVGATPAFVFTSDVTIPANLDGGSLTLRNILPASNGLTLNAPTSMAANYSLTFPAALPASQKIVTFDNSGNIAADYVVDNSTLEVSSNTLRVKNAGITLTQLASNSVTTPKILAANVTYPKIQAPNYVFLSIGTGSVNYLSGTVTLGSTTLTPAAGNPVQFSITDIISGYINFNVRSGDTLTANYALLRDGTPVWRSTIEFTNKSAGVDTFKVPVSALGGFDFTPAFTPGVAVTYQLLTGVTSATSDALSTVQFVGSPAAWMKEII